MYVFINSSFTNKYRLCHVLKVRENLKQYDFLLGAALFLWQQLMTLMGW
jgi:hypothetical protein